MTLSLPPWRSFRTLASHSEAASVSACCDFSFATLEVACKIPGQTNFALTERKQPDTWRWAIYTTQGSLLNTGCEQTREGAQRVAGEALRLTFA